MLTLLAFIAALALLIAVHEYGHYRVAVACGVKVLRFSIGFGKPIWRRQSSSGTEFVVSALPLGGYVRMLDEREGPVPAEERHRAFNNQSLRKRAAIVAAGPAANLLLAIFLYALVAWSGVQAPKPIISQPIAGSLADQAGLQGGDWIIGTQSVDGSMRPLESFDELRWRLTGSALDGQDLILHVGDESGRVNREVALQLSALPVREADAQLFERIGLVAPWSSPEVGRLLPGGAAESAGLRSGDRVVSVNETAVADGQQLRALIRASVTSEGQSLPQRWLIERETQVVAVDVTPNAERVDDVWVGRIGAYIGAAPEMVTLTFGPLEGLWHGVVRTWEVSALTVRMLFRMLTGEASLKNLSGPITIADYAGQSASLGLTSYLLFLALISVSLGVLNLLPLPVLDGGHLMYYLWEAVTGRPVSDIWMDRLQRGGMVLLLGLMSLAIFNDVARLLG